MPTVILQLERMGDLAQTLPAVRALVEAGEAPVVVVREPLEALARILVPSGTQVRVAPTSLLGPLVSAGDEPPERLAYKLALAPRRLINLTYHVAGAALATAMEPGQLWGPYLGSTGERLARGLWAAYPIAAVDARPRGRFHLVDVRVNLCREALGRDPSIERGCSSGEVTSAWGASAGSGSAEPDRRRVALFVGAGDPARVAGLEWLEAVGRELLTRDLGLDLMGGPAERDVAAELAARLGSGAASHAGRFTLEELPGALRRYAVVAGFDTGPLHLAAAVGCRVAMVLGGAAHLWETGPWGTGDIAIQALPVGRSHAGSIPPALVAVAIEARREGRDPDAPRDGNGCLVRVVRGAGEPGGIVYCRPGCPEAEEEDRRVRRRVAAMAGFSEVSAEGGAVSEAIAQGLLAARQAGKALAGGGSQDALPALRRMSHAMDDVVEGCLAREESVLVGHLIRNLFEQIPPLDPAATVAACEEVLLRARRAFPAATMSKRGA